MKFLVGKTDLVTGLQRIQSIIQSRTTMPILSNVRLQTQDKTVALFATDLEIALQDHVTADIQEKGELTVSARKFYEIARELKEDTIQVESEDHKQIVIHTGTSSFKLRALAADEYPSFPEIKETARLSVPAGLLLDMIKKTSYAVSSDLTRQSLNGVLIDITGGAERAMRMVATDGHRLSMVSREIPSDPNTANNIKVIVPKKAIHEMKKFLDENQDDTIDIRLAENHIAFQVQGYTLLSRLIDAKFPNFEDVVPKEDSCSLNLSREIFQGVIKRVSILSDEKTNAIQLSFRKGELSVSSNHPEIGEARETLPADYNGEDIDLGFNVRYVQDINSNLQGEEIRIFIQDALSPARIEDPSDPGFTGVIMPMRI